MVLLFQMKELTESLDTEMKKVETLQQNSHSLSISNTLTEVSRQYFHLNTTMLIIILDWKYSWFEGCFGLHYPHRMISFNIAQILWMWNFKSQISKIYTWAIKGIGIMVNHCPFVWVYICYTFLSHCYLHLSNGF